MKVHVFENSPSPAVAAYWFRKAVENAEKDVQDGGLVSCRTSEEAADLLNRTQSVLPANGKLRLHMFV